MSKVLRLAFAAILVVGARAQSAGAETLPQSSICYACLGSSSCPASFECGTLGCPGYFPGCSTGIPNCGDGGQAFVVCSSGATT